MAINVTSNNQSGGIIVGQVVGHSSIATPPQAALDSPPPKPSFWKTLATSTLAKVIGAGIVAAVGAVITYFGWFQ